MSGQARSFFVDSVIYSGQDYKAGWAVEYILSKEDHWELNINKNRTLLISSYWFGLLERFGI